MSRMCRYSQIHERKKANSRYKTMHRNRNVSGTSDQNLSPHFVCFSQGDAFMTFLFQNYSAFSIMKNYFKSNLYFTVFRP